MAPPEDDLRQNGRLIGAALLLRRGKRQRRRDLRAWLLGVRRAGREHAARRDKGASREGTEAVAYGTIRAHPSRLLAQRFRSALGGGTRASQPMAFVIASCSLAAAANWSGCACHGCSRGSAPRTISASSVRTDQPRAEEVLRRRVQDARSVSNAGLSDASSAVLDLAKCAISRIASHDTLRCKHLRATGAVRRRDCPCSSEAAAIPSRPLQASRGCAHGQAQLAYRRQARRVTHGVRHRQRVAPQVRAQSEAVAGSGRVTAFREWRSASVSWQRSSSCSKAQLMGCTTASPGERGSERATIRAVATRPSRQRRRRWRGRLHLQVRTVSAFA
jgi:hypothetical protein